MMKELAMATLVAGGVCTADATDASLPLTREWDKIFPKSDKVEHCKATFRNRFGITLAADVYKPKAANGKLPAIVVKPLHTLPLRASA
jgi:predicted acyl esterase